MKSYILLLGLVQVLLVLPVHLVRVSGGSGCGLCDPAQCAPLPAEGCAAGSLLDACGCCAVCAAAEGEICDGRRATARRCSAGLECVKGDESKKSKVGVCVCKRNYEVCGSDGVTYKSACALKSASATAESEGRDTISVRSKGRCATAPIIVTPPAEVFNMSGAQVYLSCEALGVPTPVLTWTKVLNDKKRIELLPGDKDNLAIQTRGGPEKHEVTGWVLIFPLTKEDEGLYECHATNTKGEASAVGAIHLVQSNDDIIIKTVTKED